MEDNKKRGLSLPEYIIVILIFAILVGGCGFFVSIILNKSNTKLISAQAKAIEISIKYGEAKSDFDITSCLKSTNLVIENGVFTYNELTGEVVPGENNDGTVLMFNNGKLTVVE